MSPHPNGPGRPLGLPDVPVGGPLQQRRANVHRQPQQDGHGPAGLLLPANAVRQEVRGDGRAAHERHPLLEHLPNAPGAPGPAEHQPPERRRPHRAGERGAAQPGLRHKRVQRAGGRPREQVRRRQPGRDVCAHSGGGQARQVPGAQGAGHGAPDQPAAPVREGS